MDSHAVFENVASMEAKFLIIIMRALKAADPRARPPVRFESAELGWARRRRIYIMNVDVTVVPGERCGWMGDTVVLSLPPRLRGLPLLSDVFRGGYQPALLHRSACRDFPGGRFRTFTGPVFPRQPAGGKEALPETRRRQRPHKQYSTAQYVDANLLWHSGVGDNIPL